MPAVWPVAPVVPRLRHPRRARLDRQVRTGSRCLQEAEVPVIDGEIIVQDKNGLSDFAALRAAIEGAPHRLVMFAFDLLWFDGNDLRRLPLIERREKLRDLLPNDQRCAIQYSEHWEGSGAALFKKACEMGLEGIVSKRVHSSYKSGPSKYWLKTKNVVESEMILLGTDYDNEGRPARPRSQVSCGKPCSA